MYIKEFIDLIQTCNYQQTSVNMNISISSLSKHISKLEEELGVLLFDRTTRTVKPSEYGLLFFEYAKKFDALNVECLAALNDLRNRGSSVLTVGFMPIVSQYGILGIISDFAELHPEATIHTVEENRTQDFFGAEKCDVIFSDDSHAAGPGVSRSLYFQDRLVAIFPAAHPLAHEAQVTVGQLSGERFLLHGRSTKILNRDSQMLLELCRDAGFEPKVAMVSNRCSMIVKLVSNGDGIAVINRYQVPETLLEGVSIVELHPACVSSIYILTPKDRAPSPIRDEFLRFVERQRLPFSKLRTPDA